MIPEILPNPLVFIFPQKLADDFHGNRLAICQLGLETSAPEWNIDNLRINIRYTAININDNVCWRRLKIDHLEGFVPIEF